jgi:hypothetical protein
MRAALLVAFAFAAVVGLAASVAADSSVPPPPPDDRGGAWQQRCADRLRRAWHDLANEDPAFTVGEITVVPSPRAVRFEGLVPDAEHARFYPGERAHFLASVVEKASKEPGELSSSVGSPRDSQASLGWSRWTRQRYATLDAQIVEGRKAFRFSHWFTPALTDCLQ